MTKGLKIPKGSIRHGSVYAGPSPLQDEKYRAMVEANVKAGATKRKQEREAAA